MPPGAFPLARLEECRLTSWLYRDGSRTWRCTQGPRRVLHFVAELKTVNAVDVRAELDSSPPTSWSFEVYDAHRVRIYASVVELHPRVTQKEPSSAARRPSSAALPAGFTIWPKAVPKSTDSLLGPRAASLGPSRAIRMSRRVEWRRRATSKHLSSLFPSSLRAGFWMASQARSPTAHSTAHPRIQQLPPKPLRTSSRPQLRLRTRSSQLNLRHSTTRIPSPLSTSPPSSRILVFTLHGTLYCRQSPSAGQPQQASAPFPRPYLRTLLAYVLSPDSPWSMVVFWSDFSTREEVVEELLMLEQQLAWREETGEVKLHGKVEAWGKKKGRRVFSEIRLSSRRSGHTSGVAASAPSATPSYLLVDVSPEMVSSAAVACLCARLRM